MIDGATTADRKLRRRRHASNANGTPLVPIAWGTFERGSGDNLIDRCARGGHPTTPHPGATQERRAIRSPMCVAEHIGLRKGCAAGQTGFSRLAAAMKLGRTHVSVASLEQWFV